MGEDKAWQVELQLENEVSLLFLIFLNILVHNEGPQRLSSADVRAVPVTAPRWAHMQQQASFRWSDLCTEQECRFRGRLTPNKCV